MACPSLPAKRSIAYLDESGGVDQKSFVLGGFVAPEDVWTSFEREWQSVLDDAPPLPPFHAAPFESGKQGFQALSLKDRKRRLGRLVDVVLAHKLLGIASIVGVDDFKRRIPPLSTEPRAAKRERWKSPYQFAALHLLGALARLHQDVGRDFGRIDVVLDHIGALEKDTRVRLETEVRRGIEDARPAWANRLGVVSWALPRSKPTPLQAADLLVWHQRRARDEEDGRNRRAWRRLQKNGIKYVSVRNFDALGYWIAGHMQV